MCDWINPTLGHAQIPWPGFDVAYALKLVQRDLRGRAGAPMEKYHVATYYSRIFTGLLRQFSVMRLERLEIKEVLQKLEVKEKKKLLGR